LTPSLPHSGAPGNRPAVRLATPADHSALAHALADAFFDDPVSCWATRPARLRPASLRRFFGAMLAIRLRQGWVWTDDSCAGAALWAPPGGWRTTVRDDLRIARAYAHPRLWPRSPMVAYGLLGIERRHPHTPDHAYLAVLGVATAAQGRGLGSRLLFPALQRCDAERLPAYLESSKESNIAFYERHGFQVMDEWRLPRGPRVWPMWREPQ
jgi:ribosomal protein S18 acetylase RimI-like enzyme